MVDAGVDGLDRTWSDRKLEEEDSSRRGPGRDDADADADADAGPASKPAIAPRACEDRACAVHAAVDANDGCLDVTTGVTIRGKGYDGVRAVTPLLPRSPARTVRVDSVDVVVPGDDAEGSADGGADDRVVVDAEAAIAGFAGDMDGAEDEPDAGVFSSSIGDGRLANGLVTGDVWLLTRADISRASRWR